MLERTTFFETSFPSASLMPSLQCLEAGFLTTLHGETQVPQSHAESEQVRETEAEKERPSLTAMAPAHPFFTRDAPRHTLAGYLPLSLLLKPVGTDAPQLCAAGEGRC